jgi:hypothetical protein
MSVIVNWELLLAILGVIGSLSAFGWQFHKDRKAANMEYIWRFTDAFTAARMLKCRRAAVTSMAQGWGGREVDEVLDFFEGLSLFYRKGILDADTINSFFGYWIKRYWLLAEPYVQETRRRLKYPTLWDGMETMAGQLYVREHKISKIDREALVEKTRSTLAAFLAEEASLLSE